MAGAREQSGQSAEAPPRPASLFVVSNSGGFVGAFPSLGAVENIVLRHHPLVSFIIQQFPADPGSPLDRVWVVLYRGVDAVAFVSNSKEAAKKRQALLLSVGQTYEDDIGYWEQPFGVVAPSAAEPLAAMQRAHQMYAGPATAEALREMQARDMARLDALTRPADEEGPLERAMRENEPLRPQPSILDYVEPVEPPSRPLPGGPDGGDGERA